MNKKLLDFLQKRDKVFFQGNFSLKKDFVRKNSKNSNEEFIEMRISTNSESPIQKGYFGNWIEVISEGCFDEAIDKDLFSFMDHKMEIEKTIATTKNGSMIFEKSIDGDYIAKIKVDISNPLVKELYEKVKNGVVSENSFIFLPDEVEYFEPDEKENSDWEIKVVHKKGELISVDPVILAFYPQNQVKLIGGEEMLEKNKKFRDEMSKSEEDDIKKEKEDEEKAKEDSEKGEKGYAAEEMDKADKEETEAYDDSEKKEEPIDADIPSDSEPNYKKLYEELKASLETAKDKEDDEDAPSSETEKPTKTEDGKKVYSEEEEKRIISNQKFTKYLKSLNREGVISKMDKKLLEQKFNKINRSNALNPIERQKLFTEEEKAFLNQNIRDLAKKSGDEDAFYTSLNILTEGLINRNLDASAYNTGLAYISTINDPEVKTELEKVIPEIEGAEYINVDTLDVVQKDILIPTALEPSQLPEGAKSENMDGSTVSVKLEPKRYSTEYTINPALANSTQTLEANTKQGRSKLNSKLRSAFYENMFENSNVMFDALAEGAYNGGFTKDAIVYGKSATALSIVDLDTIIDYAESIYGDEVYKNFVFFMHPQTKTFILNKVREIYHGDWITDKDGFKYREIKIIAAPQFQGKVNVVDGSVASGQYVAVLARKDCIVVRGLNFVTQDNPYIKMSEGQLVRYIWTRGEIKLIDPFINTRALYIGTLADSTVTQEQIDAVTDLKSLETLIAAHPNADKKTRKAFDRKKAELEKAAESTT